MNRALFLAHWRSGLLAGLTATILVLMLAMARSPQFAGVIDLLVLPKRVDSPQNGPFSRQPLQPAELKAQFDAFLNGDGLREFLSKQDCLDLGGGAFAQGLVEAFRKRISLQPLNEEGKVQIRLEDTRPRRAAILTENLVQAYQSYLENAERSRRNSELESWKVKVAAGENKLNVIRQAILSFRRMYLEAVEKYGGEKREDWRQALVLEQANSRIGALEERVKSLSGLEPTEFLKAANRLKLIDQGMADLATQYVDRGGTVKALDASGLSKDHVEVVASHQRFEDSKKRLEVAISRMLEKMNEEVKQEKDRRANLIKEREETWALLGEIGKRLEETKGVYESESATLAQTQASLYAAQLEASLPVHVIEYAESKGAKLQVKGPSLLTDLLLAPVMGLLCALLVMQLRAWQTEKKAARGGGGGLSCRVPSAERKDPYAVAA